MKRKPPKTETIAVRIPAELKESIQEYADKQNITPGESVRLALVFFLASNGGDVFAGKASNLRQMRMNAGLMCGEIAKQIGVTETTVYLWEEGRGVVARKYWKELAKELNLSEEELEAGLVQTLVDAVNVEALKKAVVSGLYRPKLLQDAFTRIVTQPQPSLPLPQTDLSSEIELKLKEENLKLRENNIELKEEIFKQRETIMKLRKQLEKKHDTSKNV